MTLSSTSLDSVQEDVVRNDIFYHVSEQLEPLTQCRDLQHLVALQQEEPNVLVLRTSYQSFVRLSVKEDEVSLVVGLQT